MISLKKKEQGFTIVELLIVIVVIGILALLVITTFTGIQKKARDSERETDVSAVAAQVEAYHAQNAKYPTLANLQDASWVSANLKGLDANALKDPKWSTGSAPTATSSVGSYGYVATPTGCDNTVANGDCDNFELTATKESGGTFVKKTSN